MLYPMDHYLSVLAVVVGMVFVAPLYTREYWEARYLKKEKKRQAELLKNLLSLGSKQPTE